MTHELTARKAGARSRSALLAAAILALPALIPPASHALVPVAIAVGSLVVGTASLGLTAYNTVKESDPTPVKVTVVVQPRHQKKLVGKKHARHVRIKAACYRVPKLWVTLPSAVELIRSKGLETERTRVCFPDRVVAVR